MKRSLSCLSLATVLLSSVASAEPPRITLDEAVRRAIAKNPNAELAAADIDRAEALVRQARAASFPTLSANGTYTRLDSARVLNNNVIAGANQLHANLAATVPIIVPQRWAQWSRAGYTVDSLRATQVDVKRGVAIATARAYLAVVVQRRLVEVKQRARDTAKAHYDYAHTRFTGGIGTRIDEVRAAQEVATTDVDVKNAEVAVVRAQEALGVLAATEGPLDTTDVAPFPPLPTLASASNETLQRADVRAATARVESADRASGLAWTDYMPFLVGSGEAFYQDPPSLTVPQTGWQAQLILTVPLYDGGLRYGQQAEREALASSAKIARDATLRQARSEVRTAFDAVGRADDALTLARDAARLAKESLDLSMLAYRAGATTNLEVVDAERRSRDADSQAAIAEDVARQARLDLLAASGRFPELK
jgi:outer membrane protein TolC